MQNLRARPYDPTNARFIGLDPFAGNMQDPQSLHKYAYVHGDPVQGVDPTGLFLAPTLAGFAIASAVGFKLRKADISRTLYASSIILGFVGGALAANLALLAYPDKLSPKWRSAKDVPSKAANITSWQYEVNVYRLLLDKATPGIDPNTGEMRTQEDIEWGARVIAKGYVKVVYDGTAETIDEGTRVGDFFGTGGKSGWPSNYFNAGSTLNCDEWCTKMHGVLPVTELRERGWVVERTSNSAKYNQTNALHNFFLVGFRKKLIEDPVPNPYVSLIWPNHTRMATPDWVLDPWMRGRPDVYEPSGYLDVWPSSVVDSSLDE